MRPIAKGPGGRPLILGIRFGPRWRLVACAAAMFAPTAALGQPEPSPGAASESRRGDGMEQGETADLAAYPQRVGLVAGGGQILIKAPRGVRRAALTKARDKIRAILVDADPEVVGRLGSAGLVVIIAPHSGRFTDLPDLRDLAGRRNAFGQPLDLARGIFRPAEPEPASEPVEGDANASQTRPTRGRPMLAVGEEDILRLIPCGPQSALHHELAHAVYRLGLSPDQRSAWREEFEDARRRRLFKGRYATLNDDEFFAELSEAYFDVAPYFCSRPQLSRVDRPAFDRLAGIYSIVSRRRATDDPARPGH